MSKRKLRHLLAVWMIIALALPSSIAWNSSALLAAPVAQELRAQQVAGTLPGGQFAKIWLGLEPETRGQNITVTTEWDRTNPQDTGVGFYILDEDDLRSVLSGSARVQEANLSSGGRLSSDAPANQLGAVFQATGGAYTIVLFNDSSADANFTLEVLNGFVTDDSGQVRDLQAAPTPASEEGEEATGDAEATGEAEATPAATAEVTATDTTTATETMTATATATPTATPEAAEAPAATAIGAPRVVRAQEVRGELPEQNDQHFLELEPSERDGNVTLTLSFDPQDSSELARRFNFWVLEEDDFRRYTDANTNVRLSDVAIAAGSSEPDLAPNQRRASFTASGLGPYIVVVYNNSTVPGSYTLRVDGGVLIDDSGQTLNSRSPITGTATITGTETVTGTATVTGGADASAGAATPAAGGRQGEPGDVYIVVAGDTLSLIARDIYGNMSYWRAICDYNNLANCDVIEVGDELRLPTLAEIDAGISPSTAAAATPTPAATAAAETEETETAEETEAGATGTVTGTGALTGTGTLTGTGATTETTGAGATDETEGDAGSTATVDVIGAMEAAGSFNTLLQALEAAGLTDSLSLPGPFTIFAPTDAAFDNLPAGALEQLLANPTGQLTQILLFHVLPGEVMAADVTNGMSATTQQGKAVNFEVSGSNIKVNGANVVTPDIEATNGVVHAIDAVILPPPD
ncbi:MAG TPA: fasciclin domain-containing protein [Caldilineaceae bacterium]|nr:fasciclin domain-containing protein [Caldilineaceae bacterium]